MDERIRARVRQEMTRQGVTQSELARRLGIKQPSLSQILGGKYGAVPQSLLDVLAALGLTLDVVKTGDVLDPAPPEPLRRGRPRSEPSSSAEQEGQDAEG